MGEVEESVDMLRYYCDQLDAERGFERPMHRAFPSEATTTVLRPHGVFGVIAPFNFPVALSVGMLAGALLGGNTVVYKPGPNSGLTASLLVEALTAGGLPADALQLVLGDGDTGRALAEHPGIDGIVFTGSHRAGMDILRACAQRPHAIPVIAEMGGKNPAYVTASADLERAAAGVARSAFGLQGQKCSACSVVFVHDSVAAQLTERLLERTRQLPLGDPRRRDVFVGPLVDAAAAGRYEAAIASARADGRVLCGGRFERSGPLARGAYAEPAIVAGLPDAHSLHTDELFLPLLAIRRFSRLDEAIAGGNAVRYGLTAGIYSRDDGEVQAFLEQAQAGVLYANRASGATTGAWPGIQSFCGWKGSGTTSKGGLGTWYLPQFMREQSRTLWHDAG
jgi:1-pyrroline-5-carboxylate dehydrogenase